jgi:hypothetical protein
MAACIRDMRYIEFCAQGEGTGACQIYYPGIAEFRRTPEKITGTRPGSVFLISFSYSRWSCSLL